MKNYMPLKEVQLRFLSHLKKHKPQYTFMQLQNPENLDAEMAKEMSKYTKIINWSGDVSQHEGWYKWFIDIGKVIWLTLTSNETDPEILQKAGIKADYLQVGFDNVWYKKKEPVKGLPEIVFCCNDYGSFQLSAYRVEVVKALKEHFKERFQIYGSGWQQHGIYTQRIGNTYEADLYNSCKIAISVSNFQFKRYFSDRLLREMACGAFVLSHWYENYEADFKDGQDFVIFKDLNELIEKAEYFLEHDEEREKIAKSGHDKVHKEHTWDVRCKELIKLINKYERITGN
jgi:glycosyltransferase involved in cell wall biosynthesis